MPVIKREYEADDVWNTLRAFYKALSRSVMQPISLDDQSNMLFTSLPNDMGTPEIKRRLEAHGEYLITFLDNHQTMCDHLIEIEEAALQGDDENVHSLTTQVVYFYDEHVKGVQDFNDRTKEKFHFLHQPRARLSTPQNRTYLFNPRRTLEGALMEARRLEAREATTRTRLLSAAYPRLTITSHAHQSYFDRIELTRQALEGLGLQTTSK